MKLCSYNVAKCAMGVILASLSTGTATASNDVLMRGDTDSIRHWYGRAGGLVGSDRVMAIGDSSTISKRVGVGYDKDVAQRTNMGREDAGARDIGITYDKDVSARTNMPRLEKTDQWNEATGTTGQSSK